MMNFRILGCLYLLMIYGVCAKEITLVTGSSTTTLNAIAYDDMYWNLISYQDLQSLTPFVDVFVPLDITLLPPSNYHQLQFDLETGALIQMQLDSSYRDGQVDDGLTPNLHLQSQENPGHSTDLMIPVVYPRLDTAKQIPDMKSLAATKGLSPGHLIPTNPVYAEQMKIVPYTSPVVQTISDRVEAYPLSSRELGAGRPDTDESRKQLVEKVARVMGTDTKEAIDLVLKSQINSDADIVDDLRLLSRHQTLALVSQQKRIRVDMCHKMTLDESILNKAALTQIYKNLVPPSGFQLAIKISDISLYYSVRGLIECYDFGREKFFRLNFPIVRLDTFPLLKETHIFKMGVGTFTCSLRMPVKMRFIHFANAAITAFGVGDDDLCDLKTSPLCKIPSSSGLNIRETTCLSLLANGGRFSELKRLCPFECVEIGTSSVTPVDEDSTVLTTMYDRTVATIKCTGEKDVKIETDDVFKSVKVDLGCSCLIASPTPDKFFGSTLISYNHDKQCNPASVSSDYKAIAPIHFAPVELDESQFGSGVDITMSIDKQRIDSTLTENYISLDITDQNGRKISGKLHTTWFVMLALVLVCGTAVSLSFFFIYRIRISNNNFQTQLEGITVENKGIDDTLLTGCE